MRGAGSREQGAEAEAVGGGKDPLCRLRVDPLTGDRFFDATYQPRSRQHQQMRIQQVAKLFARRVMQGLRFRLELGELFLGALQGGLEYAVHSHGDEWGAGMNMQYSW